MPGESPRAYYPASNNTDFLLGTMRLSTHFASFTVLRGHMDLSWRGQMPDPESLSIGKLQMFKVTNARTFFEANKGKNGFCLKPPEWLGVGQMAGGNIRLDLFNVEGPKQLLDEAIHFRDNEKGGLALCSADTFNDGRVLTSTGQEVTLSTVERPMAAALVRKIIIGAWVVPDQNPDKLPTEALRVVQLFRPDGTGVMLSYLGGKCGATPLVRFSWTVREDAVWITQVSPASATQSLLIGSGPTRVFNARTPGLFSHRERNFRLAFVPQCAAG